MELTLHWVPWATAVNTCSHIACQGSPSTFTYSTSHLFRDQHLKFYMCISNHFLLLFNFSNTEKRISWKMDFMTEMWDTCTHTHKHTDIQIWNGVKCTVSQNVAVYPTCSKRMWPIFWIRTKSADNYIEHMTWPVTGEDLLMIYEKRHLIFRFLF